MTLSIVIPCYNEGRHIARNLDHIFHQTEMPDEVIIVDNNSTDSSQHIAESYIQKFQKKRVTLTIISEKQPGRVSARITGFSLAQSELIGMIDADSLLDRSWVRNVKLQFQATSQLVALSGPVQFTNVSPLLNYWFNIMFLLYYSTYFYVMWGCNAAFRKDSYMKIGGLSDYDTFHKELQLPLIYDDTFLCEKFKTIGKVRFVRNVKTTCEARSGLDQTLNHSSRERQGALDSMNKMFRQTIDFFKMKQWVRNNYGNKTS